MAPRTRRPRPILLAPAGTLAGVGAALDAGADAVYVGLRRWGRGGSRAGLPPEEIPEAVRLCRERGAALHAALNAVPAAAELPGFLETVRRLERDGAATVILNDPGVIALVRGEFPGIAITASVGLSTLNPSGALFYRELGADAVVLPTAVAVGEVPAIKAESGLLVEAFIRCRPEPIVHGTCALPGYALEGGSPGGDAAGPPGAPSPSAKRGGPCRLVCRALPVGVPPYSIEDDLPEWIRAGVDAFKMEGRELAPKDASALLLRLRRKLDAAIAAEA